MSKTGPAEFVNQVKAETKKVTWPSFLVNFILDLGN